MLQMASFLHLLSNDLHALILTQWLDVRSLVTLDLAVSSKTCRPYWLAFLQSVRRCRCIDDVRHTAASLMWLSIRGISIFRMLMKEDAWRVPGCDLSLLKTVDLLHVGLYNCMHVTDQCILTIARVCSKLSGICVKGCCKVTDAGIIALSHGCGQLRSIDLSH